MGMAASQARLLAITARIHDVEYQAQAIQNAKLQLATQQDAVYQEYLDALDATTMTYRTSEGCVSANFNNLCGYGNITNDSVALRDKKGRLIVDQDIYEGYKNFNKDSAYSFALYMLGITDTDYNDYKKAEEEAYKKLTAGGENEKLAESRKALEAFFEENFGEDWNSEVSDIYSSSLIDSLNDSELKSKYQNLLADYQYRLYTASEYTDDNQDEYCGAALIYSLAGGEDIAD